MADKPAPLPPVRILPVYKPGKEHAGYADGYVIDPRDRGGRKNRKGRAR